MVSGVRAGGWTLPPIRPPGPRPPTARNFPTTWRNGGGRDRLQPALHRTSDLDRRQRVLRADRTLLRTRGGTTRDPAPARVAGAGHLHELPRGGPVRALGSRAPRVRILGRRVRRGPRRRRLPGRHAGGPRG